MNPSKIGTVIVVWSVAAFFLYQMLFGKKGLLIYHLDPTTIG